jgi:hypothetical protein
VADPTEPRLTRANPYAPPTAAVADLAPGSSSIEPNKHVEQACKLLWIGLWLQVLDSVIELIYAQGSAQLIGVIIGSIFGLGIAWLIVWWLTTKLRAGRNWMRWLVTILNVLGYLAIPIFWQFFEDLLLDHFKAQPISAVSAIAQLGVGIASVVLLHTKSARQWFRVHSGEDAPS